MVFSEVESEQVEKVGLIYHTMLSKEKAKSLYESAEKASSLDGEFWDCGCNNGGSAALLKLASPRKIVRLFDSFQGLPPGSMKDENRSPGRFEAKYDENLWILGPVYVGWIPDTFKGQENSRIALAHVDLDLYQSTKDALEFIIPRIVVGGIIVVDDYGSSGWNGVKTAVDEVVGEQFSRQVAAPEQITLKRVI